MIDSSMLQSRTRQCRSFAGSSYMAGLPTKQSCQIRTTWPYFNFSDQLTVQGVLVFKGPVVAMHPSCTEDRDDGKMPCLTHWCGGLPLQSTRVNVLAKIVIRYQGVYCNVQCVSSPSECATERDDHST